MGGVGVPLWWWLLVRLIRMSAVDDSRTGVRMSGTAAGAPFENFHIQPYPAAKITARNKAYFVEFKRLIASSLTFVRPLLLKRIISIKIH